MNTITVSAYAAIVAAGLPLPEGVAIVADAQISAPVDLAERVVLQPAARAEAHAEVVAAQAPEAPATKVLTKSAWRAARMTRSGKVRKAFAGLNREQALEAGLLPGYVMPSGEMRVAMAEYGRTGEFDRA